jgi:carbon monoxide dehydrogenase subunit G
VPEAEHSVTVQRPIEEVFAFLADAENDPRWRSGVVDIARVGGEGTGARYRQGVKGPMGRRVAADFEITEYAPPRTIGFRGTAGPVRPEGRYELEPADGGTRVRFSLSAQPRGFARLMTSGVARAMRSEVQAIERLPEAMGS